MKDNTFNAPSKGAAHGDPMRSIGRSKRFGQTIAALFFGTFLTLGIFSGCSRPPAVQFDHLPLIASLRTACSARNPDWLAGVRKAVDERHAAAKMTAAEHAHFHQLIAQAQSGEWEAAERACLKFEQAQLSRQRAAPAEHAHDHSHSHD